MPDGRPTDAAIVEALRALAGEKVGKTFCPSEAAKRVAEDWRPLMPRVRALAAAVGLTATQKGVPVDPIKARGPIRLSR